MRWIIFMKWFKKLGTRIDKKGRKESWAVYLCHFCLKEVERRLGNGERQKSCGCRELNPRETLTKLYRVWHNMKQRCSNPNFKQYKNYGGKGITVCDEWLDNYGDFKKWALNNGYQEDLFIDRENPDGNYEPTNCRFLTIEESNRNKTNTITMKIANEIRTLWKTGGYTRQELAEEYKVKRRTISNIINNKS